MDLGTKEFQFVSEPSPVFQDSGKLTKQKLKFGMEEILGRVSETKPSLPSPLPPVKAYLKRSPLDSLQVPKIEPRVSPIQSVLRDPARSSESDMHCDSSFR